MSTTNVEFVITASRARARVAPSTSRARVRSLVLVFVARARRDVARARRRGRATRSSRLGMTRRRRVGTSACRLFFAEMDGRRRRRSLGRARRERASGDRRRGMMESASLLTVSSGINRGRRAARTRSNRRRAGPEGNGRRRGRAKRVALQENSIFFLARNFERGEGAVGGDDGVRPRVGGAPRARARRNGVGADDAAGYGANAASSVRA